MTPIEGVDYAFPPIPTAAALAAAGKRFACRYGGPGSDSKQLHAAELAALTAAGIAVVANAEGAMDGLRGGYAAGRSWAADAEQHFRALGMPADRPIYLSVDFSPTSADWPALDAAMAGAASVLGAARVGVYGSYNVINHFASMKDRLATWYWQTYAWSGGRWHAAAHIQQYRNGVVIGGADCDLNRAMVADYGQWTGDDMLTADDISQLVTAFWGASWGTGDNRESAALRLAKASAAAQILPTLIPRLDAILAAAQDDGNTNVVLSPEALTELHDIKTQLATIPDVVVGEFQARLVS